VVDCWTSERQWQALTSVPAPVGYAFVSPRNSISVTLTLLHSHPTVPQCFYDPVEGLTLAPHTNPLDKIKELEGEIRKGYSKIYSTLLYDISPVRLKSRLHEDQEALPRSFSPSRQPASMFMSDLVAQSRCITQPEDAMISLLPVSMSMANNTNSHATTCVRNQYGISDSYAPNCPPGPNLESFMDLLFSGWNPDLPDPAMLNH